MGTAEYLGGDVSSAPHSCPGLDGKWEQALKEQAQFIPKPKFFFLAVLPEVSAESEQERWYRNSHADQVADLALQGEPRYIHQYRKQTQKQNKQKPQQKNK